MASGPAMRSSMGIPIHRAPQTIDMPSGNVKCDRLMTSRRVRSRQHMATVWALAKLICAGFPSLIRRSNSARTPAIGSV